MKPSQSVSSIKVAMDMIQRFLEQEKNFRSSRDLNIRQQVVEGFAGRVRILRRLIKGATGLKFKTFKRELAKLTNEKYAYYFLRGLA